MNTLFTLPKVITSVLLALLILYSAFFPVPIFAATTLSLSSTEVSVPSGELFILRLVFDPEGKNNYTAKIDLSFPSDLVQVDSFRFAENWIPLSQPGYDLVDNGTGTLVKTGGYPAGVSLPVVFGTVTFSVKRIGSGVITVGGSSLVLNAVSENVLFGLPVGAILTVTDQSIPYRSEFDIPDAIPIGFLFDKDVTLDDRSIEVAYLQICLKSNFGLYGNTITGFFDDATKKAVTDFQNRYFDGVLRPRGSADTGGTGLVDTSTRSSLNTACRGEAKETPPALFDVLVEPTIELPGGGKIAPIVGIVVSIITAYVIYGRIRKFIVKKKIDQLKK